MSAVTMCGTPTAATMMSACLVSSGRCRVAVWHSVTVAFSERRVSNRPSGLPDRDAAADHHDVRTGDLDLEPTQQVHDATGRAGQRRGLVEHQPAEIGRMQTVGVLGGVDALKGGVLVEMLRQRQLHDVASALRVGVQLVDGLVERRLADVGGQIAADRGDADLRAVGVLAPDVGLRSRIVADQDRAEPGRATRCGQRRHPFLEVDEDLVARGLAVKRDRTHVIFSRRSARPDSHSGIRARDAFVDTAHAAWSAAAMDTQPKVFTDVFGEAKLGPVTLRNRIIKAATFEASTPNALVTDELITYHRLPAAGGVGMTTVAYCAVSPGGRTDGWQLWMRPEAVPGLRRLTDAIHAEGAAISAQIGHAGPVANSRTNKAKAYAPVRFFNPLSMRFAKKASRADIDDITAAHANAARLAIESGFDAVEIHLGHNYLASSFLSPLINRRTDEFGGSLENRAKVARGLVDGRATRGG